MLLAARSRFDGWLSGLLDEQKGLSLFTSIGFQNLSDEIFALAGFLGMSVPYISYILLDMGLSSFTQLASSLSSPAQNAASSAAAEQVSGNYSLANTNFGQTAFENISAFQTQMSPTVSSGYFVANQGNLSATYGDSSPIIHQGNSVLRTEMLSDKAIGESFQLQKQQAQSSLSSLTDNYLAGLSNCSRISSDYIDHLAKSYNFSDSLSEKEGYAISHSANQLLSIAEDWGKQYGLNARESLTILAGANLGGSLGVLGLNLGASGDRNASRDEILNAAQHVSGREDFQHHWQKINDYAFSKAASSSQDEGTRLSKVYSDSFDSLESQQHSYQEAKSHLEQVSDNASWYTQNSHLIKRSLNQDFINWASHRVPGGSSAVLEMISKDRPEEIQPLVQDFIDYIKPAMKPDGISNDFKSEINLEGHKRARNVVEGIEQGNNRQDAIEQSIKNPSTRWQVYRDELSQKYEANKAAYHEGSGQMQDKISDHRERAIERFDQTSERRAIGRWWDGPSWDKNLSDKVKINNKSFWQEE